MWIYEELQVDFPFVTTMNTEWRLLSGMVFPSTVYAFLILTCTAQCCESVEVNMAEVTNLTRELIKRYEETSENFLVPLGETGYPLEVGLNWYPTNILSFDEQGQYIEFRGYINMEWFDPALRWSTNAIEPTYLKIPTEKIWKPDIVIHESQSHDYKSLFFENELAFVHRDGTVSWSSDVKSSTFCQVFQENFPFDRQACVLTFSSAANYQNEVVFIHLNDTSFNKTVTNGAWEAVNVTVPECPNVKKLKNGAAIRFVVELKRRRQRYYVVTLIVPCFLLSFFTSLVFLHPRKRDQRIPLATMNVLTLFVYQDLISSVGPPTGTSILGIFVLITIFEAAAATVFAILSDKLSDKMKKDKTLCDKKTPEMRMNRITSTDTEMTSDSIENITPTFQAHDNMDNEQVNVDSDSPGWYRCSKKEKTFDLTVAAILFVVKFYVFLTFVLLFGLVKNNPKEVLQCRDELYYFP